MDLFNLDHSLKDIPIPPKNKYITILTEKIEQLIARIRWKTFFFLNKNLKKEDQEYFGFKSQKTPPKNKLLDGFEYDMVEIINQIKYRDTLDNFQRKLIKEVKDIKKSTDILVKADKTTNIYKVKPLEYEKLIVNNIKGLYKKDLDRNYEKAINAEAKTITDRLKISNRVSQLQRKDAYILLKDHKDNFSNKPTSRLINPTKSEIGKISKSVLDKINLDVKEFYGLNQWTSTQDTLKWFKQIEGKVDTVFIQFDIIDFYPSITEETLKNALVMAETCTSISKDDIDIIMHSRKTVLFNRNIQWCKRNNMHFDVPMGSHDSAQIADLVGLYILYNLTNSARVNVKDVGLYRDDGLMILRNHNGHRVDSIKKEITRKFKLMGFKIDIKSNIKIANFLDVTLNLKEDTYEIYSKPNNTPLYVNIKSNHPPAVLKQIPKSVNRRLVQNSSNEGVFHKNTLAFQKALEKSGYKFKLEFSKELKEEIIRGKPKNRTRNKIWFTPPYNKQVRTNVGRLFIEIIKKHFPKGNKLHPILNINSIKLGYCCTDNLGKIIKNHNSHIINLGKKENNTNIDRNERNCNCRIPGKCMLQNECLTKNIVYKATISTVENPKEEKIYFGITKSEFKIRLANHKTSFKYEHRKNDTALSKHLWYLKFRKKTPVVKWEIFKKTSSCNTLNGRCNLCLNEKIAIATCKAKHKMLNQKAEFTNFCPHRKIHSLQQFKL